MSDPVLVAIITAAATVPGSIIAALAAFFAYRASDRAKDAVAISLKTEINTNHMKDELVALTAKSSHAEGVLEGEAHIDDAVKLLRGKP